MAQAASAMDANPDSPDELANSPYLNLTPNCNTEDTDTPFNQSDMKLDSIFSLTAAFMALFFATANAHGQMTKPTPRPISEQYRADCGALSGAGDQELQYAPVELLSSRTQSDRPAAATFNIMNGCRGTVYEANNTVTELTAETPFSVEWVIQAPHPGTMVLSIVKPSTDSSGTITYTAVAELFTIDPFAENSSDNTSTTATIPASVTGCGSAGDCALQFYWHSDLASQTYPTCADIIVTGSGESSSQSPTTSAPSAATSGPTDAPTSTTDVPVATATPAATFPGNNEASSSSSSEKCTRRQRRLTLN